MSAVAGVDAGRIAPLDGVRGMAALMVMGFHFVVRFGQDLPPWIQQASVIGQAGVDLFFVLSGFLITRILLQSRGEQGYYRGFYTRRVLRIFPLYFGFLAAYFFLLPRLLGQPSAQFHQQVWAWTFLENLPMAFPSLDSRGPSHFWSLAVEEHFYLLWPFLVAMLSRRWLLRVVVAIILLSPLVRILLAGAGLDIFFLTIARMDSLSLGALLAILAQQQAFPAPGQLRVLRVAAIAIPCLLVPIYMDLSRSGADALQVLRLSLTPAFFAVAIALCIFDPGAGWLARLLSTPLLRWIGGISFGMYVFHPSCFLVVMRYFPGAGLPVSFVLAFGLTILVAAASFRWYERPILDLRHRLPARPVTGRQL